MSVIKKVAIIGYFGEGTDSANGQSIKTISLYEELSLHTNWNIIKIDTADKIKRPIRLVIKMMITLITTQNIIVLLSVNGKKVLFPLLYFFIKVRKTKVYHDVIGGNLADQIEKCPKQKKYLKAFQVNWVETKLLKTELEKVGVMNVEVIPNFRKIIPLSKEDIRNYIIQKPYRFCTFSRVTKEKGIEDAVNAIEKINQEAGTEVCKLDIYGAVDKAYKNRFDQILEYSADSVCYCGVIDNKYAMNKLKLYYGVLFPTYWKSEGGAGTIAEAFFAGVPVIATDWRCNGEMIISGYNGILYPSSYASDLKQAILWLITHDKDMIEMKENCLKSAEVYQPDNWIKYIVSKIQEE